MPIKSLITLVPASIDPSSQLMFVCRGFAVSLSIFLLLYCLLSTMISVGWTHMKGGKLAEGSRANVLYFLRVFPMLASAAVTIAFIVPSFQILEPRSAAEGMGVVPLVLSLFAVLLLGIACFQVTSRYKSTSLVVSRWLVGASVRKVGKTPQTITFIPGQDVPSIVLIGIGRPRVLVSEFAAALLTGDELDVSLRHERYHLRSRDNLKKLMLGFCRFPGMARLDHAWYEAQERAADDAAATDAASALNLASALVKLARLAPVQAETLCLAGFVTGPVESRVLRLIDGKTNEAPADRRMAIYAWGAAAALIITSGLVVANYSAALLAAHAVTEWLVR
jgi:beta-lactamase regulating signal transducer with metallopeptidase domain